MTRSASETPSTKSEMDPSTFDASSTGTVGNISMATALGACSGFAVKKVHLACLQPRRLLRALVLALGWALLRCRAWPRLV